MNLDEEWEILCETYDEDNNHIDNLTCESYNNWYRSLES